MLSPIIQESQDKLISSVDSQESDNEILNNVIDYRINKLKNYQNQIDIQLKHLSFLEQTKLCTSSKSACY